jgi:hypothetical protein
MRRRFLFFFLVSVASGILPVYSASPTIARKSENSGQIGLYEKYEIILELGNLTYSNPYNPDEVDVRAVFTAPGGRQWTICGFYDNFNNRNQWKVRFAPNETGTWSYLLSVATPAGSGTSPAYTFMVVESAHKGWVHTSPVNPHYLLHDNGAPFYGISMFWPWRIAESGLNTLQQLGCNLVGLWNVTYDDGTLIESISSGLGRYDQNKCNRIDTILEWMEKRDMVLMLSIWPHDLFCKNLSGWAQLWNSNPYKQLCDVLDIYGNQEAWGYQEKQYRYIIARWGHSRGLGLWEIINEINGTDAWAAGRTAAGEEWIRKVHGYLRAHDPYDRPVTASMSGGQWWPSGYAIFDMPNVHMYETGWTAQYNNNPLRSSLWTYHSVTRQMWNGFAKPAVMGEAGWLDNYGGFSGESDEYAIMYHNALWSSWASGLSCTPIWWAYDARVFGTRVQERMKMFSRLAPQIDYAHRAFQPADASVTGNDAFAMTDGVMAFGWTRDEWGRDISLRPLQLKGLLDSVYTVEWFDTWTGMVIASHIRPSISGLLVDEVPQTDHLTPDLAFVIRPAERGITPARLGLMAVPRFLFSDGESTSEIQCLIFDARGRFCSAADNALSFSLSGLGRLIGPDNVQAERGRASILLQSDSVGTGTAQIIASSPGLVPDTVLVTLSDEQLVESFEDYGELVNLNLYWKAKTGTFAALILAEQETGGGSQSLRVDYGIGNGKPPYAGFFYTFPATLRSARYLRFYLRGDGSLRSLVVQINRNSSSYWQYELPLASAAWEWVELPLNAFTANDGSGPLDLTLAAGISFNILKGSGTDGSGTIYLDEIRFASSAATGGVEKEEESLPVSFQLYQNYPNPFNGSTEIGFSLPVRAAVELAVYNVRGELVEKLAEGERAAGIHRVLWHAGGLSSGTYFIALQAGGRRIVDKCVLLR